MKNIHILEAMTNIRPEYIQSAQQKLGYEPAKPRPASGRRHGFRRALITFAAVLIFAALMCGTAMAVNEDFREAVIGFFETLFPPKDITVMVEGFPEERSHSAQGQLPDTEEPGFVIYVDSEHYSMTEENGAYYIRPIPMPEADPSCLPACEMVIEEMDSDWLTAAETVRSQMEGNWETLSSIMRGTEPPRLNFYASDGSSWDSPCEDHYFYQNGQNGSFHIVLRYFREAAEGHGVSFAAMLSTFSVIAPQDAGQYSASDNVAAEAMQKEIDYAEEQILEMENAVSSGTLSQAELNTLAQEKYELWDAVLNKLWSTLEQTMDEEAFRALTDEQISWIAAKEAAAGEAGAGLEGTSLYPLMVYPAAAEMTRSRVYELFSYLN